MLNKFLDFFSRSDLRAGIADYMGYSNFISAMGSLNSDKNRYLTQNNQDDFTIVEKRDKKRLRLTYLTKTTLQAFDDLDKSPLSESKEEKYKKIIKGVTSLSASVEGKLERVKKKGKIVLTAYKVMWFFVAIFTKQSSPWKNLKDLKKISREVQLRDLKDKPSDQIYRNICKFDGKNESEINSREKLYATALQKVNDCIKQSVEGKGPILDSFSKSVKNISKNHFLTKFITMTLLEEKTDVEFKKELRSQYKLELPDSLLSLNIQGSYQSISFYQYLHFLESHKTKMFHGDANYFKELSALIETMKKNEEIFNLFDLVGDRRVKVPIDAQMSLSYTLSRKLQVELGKLKHNDSFFLPYNTSNHATFLLLRKNRGRIFPTIFNTLLAGKVKQPSEFRYASALITDIASEEVAAHILKKSFERHRGLDEDLNYFHKQWGLEKEIKHDTQHKGSCAMKALTQGFYSTFSKEIYGKTMELAVMKEAVIALEEAGDKTPFEDAVLDMAKKELEKIIKGPLAPQIKETTGFSLNPAVVIQPTE